MKTLVIAPQPTTTTEENKTVSQIRKEYGSKLDKAFKRVDKLVNYVSIETTMLVDLLADLKLHQKSKLNDVYYMLACFEKGDESKLTSFLLKVVETPYFLGDPLKGKTPKQFISFITTLVTTKDKRVKKYTFKRVLDNTEWSYAPADYTVNKGLAGCERSAFEYKVETSFNVSLIKLIFEAYL